MTAAPRRLSLLYQAHTGGDRHLERDIAPVPLRHSLRRRPRGSAPRRRRLGPRHLRRTHALKVSGPAVAAGPKGEPRVSNATRGATLRFPRAFRVSGLKTLVPDVDGTRPSTRPSTRIRYPGGLARVGTISAGHDARRDHRVRARHSCLPRRRTLRCVPRDEPSWLPVACAGCGQRWYGIDRAHCGTCHAPSPRSTSSTATASMMGAGARPPSA